MDELVHKFRANIFAREREYRLAEGSLDWSDGEKRGTVPLRDIVGIRIYQQPGAGMGPTMRRAIVRTRAGKTILLASNHYVRFAVIEDRAATYRPFITGLVQRLAVQNPQAKFLVGHAWGLWVTWLVLLFASVGMLILAVWVFVHEDFPWKAMLYIPIVLASVPAALLIVTRSRPRQVDPKAMPPGTFE